MIEIGELERIAQKEDGGVVAHQIPIAFFRVELDGEAADVALGVGRAALAGDGGEARKERSLLAHARKQLGARVPRDVVRHREGAVSAGALRVHAALGDDLTIEVRELLQQPNVLEQRRAARSGRHRILIVDDGRSRSSRQLLRFVFHGSSALSAGLGAPPAETVGRRTSDAHGITEAWPLAASFMLSNLTRA